ncbi:putative hydrolase [Tuber magnatum]|uniref:Putative hydrolase n=1 Tax=Tuber magnatum TaxID=42249 RepID=A0A317SDN2_9PEZI|nr:putative hydrolase [Tuber magnatum]
MLVLTITLTALLFSFTATTAEVPPFDSWPSRRIKLPEVFIHLKHHGAGPPLVLLHGQPQHSLTWHTIAPILARDYTVIVPDGRGAGASRIPNPEKYTAEALAKDVDGILTALNISGKAFIVGHDLGSKAAAAYAHLHPEKVARLVVSEFALPGFGFEDIMVPDAHGSLNSNWHLSLFTVPDAAMALVEGRKRKLLQWYFWHAAYSGLAVSFEHLERYVYEYTKPGYLRSAIGWYSSVLEDAVFFKRVFDGSKIEAPVLYLGGEASFPGELAKSCWERVAKSVTAVTIPECGHWIGDENLEFVANQIGEFFRGS